MKECHSKRRISRACLESTSYVASSLTLSYPAGCVFTKCSFRSVILRKQPWICRQTTSDWLNNNKKKAPQNTILSANQNATTLFKVRLLTSLDALDCSSGSLLCFPQCFCSERCAACTTVVMGYGRGYRTDIASLVRCFVWLQRHRLKSSKTWDTHNGGESTHMLF